MAVVVTWALIAGLGGPGVELEWRAPEGCPGQLEVAAEVDRLLAGRRVEATVAVRTEVVKEGAGFAATVAIDVAAPRTLRAQGCDALARAVALVIAVAVDPIAVAGNFAEEPALVPAAPVLEPPLPVVVPVMPEPVVRERPEVVARELPEPVRAPVRVFHGIGVRGGMLTGATGSPTGAVAVVYGLERGLLRVEARVLYGTPRLIMYPEGGSARVQALTFGGLACVAAGSEWFRVPLCLGAEAGPLIGRGVDVAAPQLRADAWVSGLFAAGIVARVHRRAAIVLGTELAVALRRPAFHVGTPERLVRAPSVGARILLGVELRVGR